MKSNWIKKQFGGKLSLQPEYGLLRQSIPIDGMKEKLLPVM